MNIVPYKKRNGRTYYKLSAYLGMNPRTGKPVEITRQGFESYKDAQLHYLEELRKFEAQTAEGALLPAITFAELTEKWLPVYQKSVVSSTFQKTLSKFTHHIAPYMGNMKVDKIDLPMLNRFAIKLSESFSRPGEVFSYVKRVLGFAVDLGYLSHNPANNVTIPKTKKVKKQRKYKFLEREELIEYLAAAKNVLDHQWFVYIHLLAMTGLRRGEALALQGKDIDGDMLTISKTITTGEGNKPYIGPPKNEASFRTIRIDATTLNYLQTILGEPEDFIFRQKDGKYWSLSRPGHYMYKLSKVAGVQKISPHILRHTHCALMFEAGAGLKEVQDRLGHKDIEITLSIYNHVSARKKHEAIDRLTAYLNGQAFGENSVDFDSYRVKALKNTAL